MSEERCEDDGSNGDNEELSGGKQQTANAGYAATDHITWNCFTALTDSKIPVFALSLYSV
jgi:hypothetical protein